ncbi:hypothetical protein IVA87_22745 [Bradyrhizobium sp. 147]|uniref:DUF6941 family protein n=1 Tax=Bradyrhizobium sp. 147 TaxID=2782623 RepID=UPI001FFBEBCD|nr:hypothetical protein [Bradyrhizobium sp. 147]MCK1682157.1 hypothetical protein [Bradyrhizobium sp. 147]
MTRIATVQFCDEVAGAGLGKFAFVGIYQADLIVPVVPFTLPQLFFVTRFRTPVDDRPKKLRVRIERPGHPPFEVDNTALLEEPVVTPGADAKFYQVQMISRIAPFEITELGTVKVFVEDEVGDNYAGGLRLKAGIHPEFAIPQIAGTASLIAGHFSRLAKCSSEIQEQSARQLIEALSAFMLHLQVPPKLQFPDLDLRLLLDDRRAHIFFPEPLDYTPSVEIEPTGNFDEVEIESVDRFGFIIKFAPTAPADLAFNYSLGKQTHKPGRRKSDK